MVYYRMESCCVLLEYTVGHQPIRRKPMGKTDERRLQATFFLCARFLLFYADHSSVAEHIQTQILLRSCRPDWHFVRIESNPIERIQYCKPIHRNRELPTDERRLQVTFFPFLRTTL